MINSEEPTAEEKQTVADGGKQSIKLPEPFSIEKIRISTEFI